MGVRHVVLFRLAEGVTAEQVDAIAEGLAALPAAIGEIRGYRFGPDLGLSDTTWDFAVVADFDSAEDYLVYRDHPEHRAFIAAHVEPLVVERVAVQHAT
ncbi:MAG TPA: Dabb family protein [Acidimicrobiales bacterium]